MSVGQGGHEPCIQAFGADQFDEASEQTGEAMQSFFNWWYFGLTCGAVTGTVIFSYIQEYVGWAIGFGIPSIVVVVAPVLFLAGRKSYRCRSPGGSPLTQVAQVIVAAVRKRHVPPLEVDQEGGKQDYTTNQFKFLDKAAIKDEVDACCSSTHDWRLCSTTQVEEVKQLLRLLPILLSCLMFAVVTAQTATFFVKQSSTMDRTVWSSFKVTPATFLLSVDIAAMLTIPIYDRVAVPLLTKITKIPTGLTVLQRIGAGMFLSVIQMAVAALVEAQRLRIAKEHGLDGEPDAVVPMSVWWLLPQDVLCGVAAVLASVGLQQLFYEEMPGGMRSLGAAAVAGVFGMGEFLSSFIMSMVEAVSDEWLADNLNSGRLDCWYWLLVGLSSMWFVGYVTAARCFVYKH
ncbi:hypothetical protein ACLOJK_001139 [Asimina triloba]